MTETSDCLESHPQFLWNTGSSIFYLQIWSILQTFQWIRKFEGLPSCIGKNSSATFICVQQNVCQTLPWIRNPKFSSYFPVGLSSPVCTVKVKQFFVQKANFVPMKINPYGMSSKSIILSWSKLVFSRADGSRCHEYIRVTNHLNGTFYRSLSIWKPFILLKYTYLI